MAEGGGSFFQESIKETRYETLKRSSSFIDHLKECHKKDIELIEHHGELCHIILNGINGKVVYDIED